MVLLSLLLADDPSQPLEPVEPGLETIEAPADEGGLEIVVEDQAIVLESPTPGLTLTACSVPPPPALAGTPPSGVLSFSVVVRRGEVKVVTSAPVDPSLEWLSPCLERELASHEWDRGRHEVEVRVEPGS